MHAEMQDPCPRNPLAMSQGFGPVLAANGGGTTVNVLWVLTWINLGAGDRAMVLPGA